MTHEAAGRPAQVPPAAGLACRQDQSPLVRPSSHHPPEYRRWVRRMRQVVVLPEACSKAGPRLHGRHPGGDAALRGRGRQAQIPVKPARDHLSACCRRHDPTQTGLELELVGLYRGVQLCHHGVGREGGAQRCCQVWRHDHLPHPAHPPPVLWRASGWA